MAKIEEMERLLREAQSEKLRLLEHRVICQNNPNFLYIDLFIYVDVDVCLNTDVINSHVACAGARDGDAATGSGGGATQEGGSGEATAGGDEQETETCGERSEVQRETKITGIQRTFTPDSFHSAQCLHV